MYHIILACLSAHFGAHLKHRLRSRGTSISCPPNRLRRPCQVAPAGVAIPAACHPGLWGGVRAGRGSHSLGLPAGPAADNRGGMPVQADDRLRPRSRPGSSGPNPVGLQAPSSSKACTGLLERSLREGTALDANIHGRHAGLKCRLAQKKREAAIEQIFAQLLAAAGTSTKRRMLLAKETGTWLTTMPNRLNATELSADEFQDSLWLRLGLAPLSLPDRCDGCGHHFSLGHAMTCKKGGLVLLRHNNVVGGWHHLCAQALSPAAVSDEGVAPSLRPGALTCSRLRRTFNLLRSGRQRGGSTSRRRATSETSGRH
jgi:hypothetical protein